MLEVNLGDVTNAIAAGTAGVLTLIEISPLKWNPLSAIGRIINRAVLDEQKTLKAELTTSIKDINRKVDTLDARMEESEIKAARMRIQRFADEMYGNVRHSKEHFDLILMDITAYNIYCKDHPGFINEKTKVAQDIITDKYEECLREHSFRV